MPSEKPTEATVFNTARNLVSSADREAYLTEVCEGDAPLRERVDKLLTAFSAESQFHEQPAAEFESTVLTDGSGGNLAASFDAGLAPAFSEDQAIVLGVGSHSVLKILEQTLDQVPRVVLRESTAEGADPIVRPKSIEMPQRNSDSRYRLDGEIARGGMGAILKGRDTDLGRDLAIKVLLDQHKDKPEVVQRFVEEAQIGGQLQHPGIAPIYELGQFADKRPFFAMKLVKGETLSKLLADREEPTAERGKYIGVFEQICQTMAYAHSRGVIHRDLKPANIMVGAFGEVQVMDWGLAKVLPAGGVADEKKSHDKQQGQSVIKTLRSQIGSDVPGTFGSQTQMGSVMGTPAYMPPEQALGEIDNLDERADVFGLGAILCEILTGQPPYTGSNGTQVYRMASRGKLGDCFTRLDNCGADEALVSLTKHCLELEPKDRPRGAGELAASVTSYLESVETRLRATEVERAAESARALEARKRMRVTTALAASVLLLISLSSGGWLYMERQEANRQSTEAATQRKHAEVMQDLAEERETQRKAAELAEGKAKAAEAIAVQEKETARQALARSQTSLAEAAYREFDSPAMLAALKGVPEDLRDSDWRYLRARAENSQTVFIPPKDNYFVGIAAHPKKPGVFASALIGNTFVFVDALSGQRVFEFPGTEKQRTASWCRSVDFSPDGTRMIAGALNNGGVAIYDTATGSPLVEWVATSKDVEWVRFSPDATKALDFTSALELTVRDATNGRPLWSAKSVGRAVFSPKGEVIIPSGRSIRVHDGTTGALIKTLPELRDSGTYPALSPDGTVLYLGCSDGVVRGQRLADGVVTFEQRLTDSRQTVRVALSADGRRLLGVEGLPGGRRMARVWDTATGITLQTLMGGTGGIEDVAIHPLTDEAFISGPDTRVWTQATREVESKTPGSSVAAVFWGAEDVFIAGSKPAKFGADGLWNDLPFSMPEECRGGFFAAAGGKTAAIGKYVTSGSPVTIFRKDADGFTLLHTVRTKGSLARLRVSPDGTRLITAAPGALVEIFDTATGQRVCECDGKVVKDAQALDWIGSDRIVAIGTRNSRGSASAEEHVFVWDAATGKVLGDVRNSAVADVLAVAPDGRTFAEAGENKRVRIRDAETLEVLREFRAHDGAITALAYHPTQPVLATGSTDLTVRLWSLEDLRLIEEARPSTTDPTKLSFSPRGTRLASTDRGSGISFLNLVEPPLGKFTRRSSMKTSFTVTDLSPLRKIASDHARAGRFAEAKIALAALLKAGSNSSMDWFPLAVVLAQLGDDAAYCAHSHEFLIRFANTGTADAMERAGKACLLLPIDDTDRAIALRLAHKAVATDPQGPGASYYLAADGLAHYRSGDFDKTIEVLTPLAGNSSAYVSTYAGAVLALAQHQLGKTAEARASLDRADAIAASAFPPSGTDLGGSWHDVLFSRLLLKEARATIAPGTQPPPPPPYVLAQAHARAGRWTEARTALTAAVKENPDSYYARLHLAVLLKHLEDRAAHRELAHEMIERFGNSNNLDALACTAKVGVLFPLESMDAADLATMVRMAGKLIDGGTKNTYHEFDACLVRYRAGDFSNVAGTLLQRGEAYATAMTPGARALLALAQHRLGQTAEARVTLARAEVLAQEKLPKPGTDLGSAWPDVVVSQMLLREARETIGEK